MGMREEVAGFSRVAGEYERGRPDYPAASVAWIVEQTGLGPGTVLVDLAAGTGKLTRLFGGCRARVIAVEPLAEMRAHIGGEGVEAVEGTAEAMGLPDGLATAVTVGQAFHWFSTEPALAEIARVLKPGGYLALVWNQRDLTQDLQADLTRIMASRRHDTPSYQSGEWARVMEATERFDAVGEHHVAHSQWLDADGLTDRVASTSFIALLPPEESTEVLRQVRELVPAGGKVELSYDCAVFLYRRR